MIIDAILLVFILLSAFIGYKKGFVSVVIKLFGFILAVVIAYMAKDSIAEFIDKKVGLGETISTTIEETITSQLEKQTEGNDKSVVLNNKIFNNAIDEIENAGNDQKETLVASWANKTSMFVMKGIGFAAAFISIIIIVGIVGIVLNTIVKLPVLKTFNSMGGMIAQIVVAIIEISAVLAILSFISPLNILGKVYECINSSMITKILYNNNIVVMLISNKLLK